MKNTLIKKADLILICVLLVIAAALLAVFTGGERGAVAVVTVDGKKTGEYPLSIDGTFPLNDGTNTLVIENGEAYLSDANCPDKLCVKMGRISRTGQTITCLPNRLIAKVEGAGEQEFDALVG